MSTLRYTAMSVVDRSFEQSVEEELAKMDPETLQYLDTLHRINRKEAVEKRRQMGWNPVLDELEGKAYCEIQKKFTYVFKCPETHVCKTTGQCARCQWDEKKYHLLARREEVLQLEEKGFVFDASFESLCDEWSPEKMERCKRAVERLANEYAHYKTEKKIRKKKKKGVGIGSQTNEMSFVYCLIRGPDGVNA